MDPRLVNMRDAVAKGLVGTKHRLEKKIAHETIGLKKDQKNADEGDPQRL